MALLHLDQAGFDQLMSQGGVALVDFWATWCAPCRMLGPVIEELAADYDGKIAVGKVDVDENQELAMRFGIMSIPTVLLFKDGQEVQRVVGLGPKEDYCKLIDSHI